MSSTRSPARSEAGRPDRGQSTVELALVLPVLVLMALFVIHAGVLVREQILVTHAAREGARASALDADRAAVEQAVQRAGPLDPKRLAVHIRGRGRPGSRVTVDVTYVATPPVPLLRSLVPSLTLHGEATMRVER